MTEDFYHLTVCKGLPKTSTILHFKKVGLSHVTKKILSLRNQINDLLGTNILEIKKL